jgi:hypothetical protein
MSGRNFGPKQPLDKVIPSRDARTVRRVLQATRVGVMVDLELSIEEPDAKWIGRHIEDNIADRCRSDTYR